MAERIEAGEIEVQALKELLELAAKMKKTGVLGMINSMLEDYEEMLAGMQGDTSFIRLAFMAGALMEAARRLEASKTTALKMNMEDDMYCLFDALASTDPAGAERKGLTGLMGALRDPDVQKGLGFLLALAKNLGACLRRLEEQRK